MLYIKNVEGGRRINRIYKKAEVPLMLRRMSLESLRLHLHKTLHKSANFQA